MPTPTGYAEFRSRIRKAFTKPVSAPERTRREQRDWWLHCYQPREHERRIFLEDFLDDDAISICRVTGQIGAGKTSFVLDKLENPNSRVCNGIWIDVGDHASRLAEIQAKARLEYAELGRNSAAEDLHLDDWIDERIVTELNMILAQRVELRFRQHFWWLRAGLSADYTFVDVWHQLDIRCPEPTRKIHELHAEKVNRDVAAALLLVRADDTSTKIRERAYRAAGTAMNKREDRLKAIRQYIEETRDEADSVRLITQDLTCAQLVTLWLRAYASFFGGENLVLVLDNVDRVFSTVLHGTIVDYARRLADELRSTRLLGEPISADEQRSPRVFKVIYTIRDWNVRTHKKHYSGGAVREMAIALGEDGKGYSDKRTPVSYLPLDRPLLRQIIKSRVEMAETSFANWKASVETKLKKEQGASLEQELAVANAAAEWLPVFSSLVTCLWDPDVDDEEHVTLEELTNGSIRNALSVAWTVALKILEEVQRGSKDKEQFINADYRVALRPRVIDWLFDIGETGHDLAVFIREAQFLVHDMAREDYLCCAHRLILTYLYRLEEDNGLNSARTNVAAIAEQLERHTGLPPSRTREALHFLFEPGEYQADYITIYQERQIRAPKDIEDEAVVHINPRGRALLKRVMPRLEYWVHIAEKTDKTTNLYELEPERAVSFLRKILNSVRRAADAHEKNWMLLVKEHMKKRGLVDSDFPLKVFSDARLTYGQAFYMHRVANSHLHSVIQYLLRLFRHEDKTLLLPGESVSRWPPLGKEISLDSISDSKDLIPAIRHYEGIVGSDQMKSVRSLHEIAKDFDKIRVRLDTLGRKTSKKLFSTEPYGVPSKGRERTAHVADS